MHTKRLAEENADLRNEVEFLRKATEKYKSEILNQTKRLEITTRQPDARRLVKPTYRSRYSPRAQSVSGLRVISRPGVAASKVCDFFKCKIKTFYKRKKNPFPVRDLITLFSLHL